MGSSRMVREAFQFETDHGDVGSAGEIGVEGFCWEARIEGGVLYAEQHEERKWVWQDLQVFASLMKAGGEAVELTIVEDGSHWYQVTITPEGVKAMGEPRQLRAEKSMIERLESGERWEDDVDEVEALEKAIKDWWERISLPQRDRWPD